jgi:hypothetical protein
MDAVIAYGSGRGTTAKVGEAIVEGMVAAGVKAVAVSLEYVIPSRLQGKHTFAFCTCGMDRPGETLVRLYEALAGRGAAVVWLERFRSALSYFPLSPEWMSRCQVNGLERRNDKTIPDVSDHCVRCLECTSWRPRSAITVDPPGKERLATSVIG